MRTATTLLLLLLFLVTFAFGQTLTHKVTLAWTDENNPAGTTYVVSRAIGTCTGTPAFAVLASGLAVKTYEDANVSVGNYCYQVKAVYQDLESPPSNNVGPIVLPFAVEVTATVTTVVKVP